MFETSHDLYSTVHRSDRVFFIDIFALVGGVMFLMVFIISLWFKIWVSWLMHLTIVRTLFKIDPQQAAKPKSKAVMENKDPRALLSQARTVAKKRVTMTRSSCDRFVMIFEGVVSVITCSTTKFGKVLKQGRQEVQEDLNVYNIMQRMRLM